MKKQRLLELAGIQLDENVPDDIIDRLAKVVAEEITRNAEDNPNDDYNTVLSYELEMIVDHLKQRIEHYVSDEVKER